MDRNTLIQKIIYEYKNENVAAIPAEQVIELIKSVSFLENILSFSNTCFFIIEYQQLSYLYCSANVTEVFGHQLDAYLQGGPSFTLKQVHPDDLQTKHAIHARIIDIFSRMPEAVRNNMKFSFTARGFRKDGTEFQFLQNNFFLKWTDDGKPLMKLFTITDISPYKKNDDMVFYVTQALPNGENKIVLQENFTASRDVALSTRELEILNLIALGHSVKQIADQILLNQNTVKAHKRNIMKKLGTKNSAQMVALAALYGLTLPNESHSQIPIKA